MFASVGSGFCVRPWHLFFAAGIAEQISSRDRILLQTLIYVGTNHIGPNARAAIAKPFAPGFHAHTTNNTKRKTERLK